MKRAVLLRALVLLAFLAVLAYLSWEVLTGPPAPQAAAVLAEDKFQQWFWGLRSLDVAVQVALLFVSSLGVAALLPSRSEEET
jgi:hypothetical protein